MANSEILLCAYCKAKPFVKMTDIPLLVMVCPTPDCGMVQPLALDVNRLVKLWNTHQIAKRGAAPVNLSEALESLGAKHRKNGMKAIMESGGLGDKSGRPASP